MLGWRPGPEVRAGTLSTLCPAASRTLPGVPVPLCVASTLTAQPGVAVTRLGVSLWTPGRASFL